MHLQLPSLFTAGLSLASALSLPARGDTRKRAAYLLSNNPGGDNLLALSISVHDGTVSNPVLTPTGGNGLLGNTAKGPAGPDGLFGQGAVVVSHDVSDHEPLPTVLRALLMQSSTFSLSILAATLSPCSGYPRLIHSILSS